MSLKDVVRFVKISNKIQKGDDIMEGLKIQSLLSDEQKKQKQKVLNDINSIQKSFDLMAPDEKKDYAPNLTRLDLKEQNDNIVEREAKGNLAYYKAKNENDIESNYGQQKQNILEQIDKANENIGVKVNDIKNDATQQKEDAKNALINKNIVRSSIYQNLISDIEKNELASLDNAKAEIDSKVEKLTSKLSQLDSEKQNALELFDIAYAIKLQDEIDGINKKISDYNTQAIKYNNSIEQKEKQLQEKYDSAYQDYVNEVEERNRKVLEFASKYGVGLSNVRVQKQKYEIVKSFLNTLDKQSALEMLNENDDFKNAIGETYFNTLLEEVNGRKA